MIIVTGSGGLVGSACVKRFSEESEIIGIDNNYRAHFFGDSASVIDEIDALIENYKNYRHEHLNITSKDAIEDVFRRYGREIKTIIHCAAQPSHDWAASNPHLDAQVNIWGTLNLLEATRKYAPEATFIYCSTNKVYGDSPNNFSYIEEETRFTPSESHPYKKGFSEELTIDNSMHSVFGASKLSADIYVQEYGRYFGIKTASFRGGCLTGPNHKGVELHGFLSYLVKACILDRKYKIIGYGGKQVRDNIDSRDLAEAFYVFSKNPKIGERYNIGGGPDRSISILEAINKIQDICGLKVEKECKNKARSGDHKWWISDVTKFTTAYPEFKYRYDLEKTINEIILSYK